MYKPVILIDNGHGSNTPGKCSPAATAGLVGDPLYFREYQWSRQIACDLYSVLTSLGYTCHLVVPELTDIGLAERCRRVNAWCAKYGKANCLLISVHANAAGADGKWHDAQGWTAWTTKGITAADTLAKYLYKAADEVFRGRKVRRYSTGSPDWESNFYILLHSYCPAVLTENFFQDNKDDVAYLLSDKGRGDVIECHVRGIEEYVKNEFKWR